jgi:hypothetical protein
MACKGSKRPFGKRMRAAGKEDIEALSHCVWITDS